MLKNNIFSEIHKNVHILLWTNFTVSALDFTFHNETHLGHGCLDHYSAIPGKPELIASVFITPICMIAFDPRIISSRFGLFRYFTEYSVNFQIAPRNIHSVGIGTSSSVFVRAHIVYSDHSATNNKCLLVCAKKSVFFFYTFTQSIYSYCGFSI